MTTLDKILEDDKENLYVKLTQMPRPHEIVPLPRLDKSGEPVGHVIMVILTAEENMLVKKAGGDRLRAWYKDQKKSELDLEVSSVFNDLTSMEILYRVCRRIDDIDKTFFPSAKSIEKVLTLDEIALLLNHYYTMMYKYGPRLDTMTEEQQVLWIKRITEDASVSPSFLLNSLSSEALKNFTISLANQLKSLQMEKSLSAEQPETM